MHAMVKTLICTLCVSKMIWVIGFQRSVRAQESLALQTHHLVYVIICGASIICTHCDASAYSTGIQLFPFSERKTKYTVHAHAVKSNVVCI